MEKSILVLEEQNDFDRKSRTIVALSPNLQKALEILAMGDSVLTGIDLKHPPSELWLSLNYESLAAATMQWKGIPCQNPKYVTFVRVDGNGIPLEPEVAITLVKDPPSEYHVTYSYCLRRVPRHN